MAFVEAGMENYAVNTGEVIIEIVDNGGYDPMAIPRGVEKNMGHLHGEKSGKCSITMLRG